MPDIWLDVDAAVTVPVNLMPLIDDTDFKTRETGVVFNAAGMDLVWNFITSAGVITQTAVTPTDTAGNYDWTNSGDGMYKIELPASGGASANNDTEGYGWFTGFATGVLPWRGPTIGFRAAGLNDKLTDSAYDTTRGLSGTALPAAAADAAGGLPISDAGGLDLDAKIGALTFTVANKVDANATHINAVSTSAVTTIRAVQGLAVDGVITTLTNDPTGVGTLLTRLGTPGDLGSGASVAANLADIEAQTDDIGTAGAGLTGVPDLAGVTTLLSRLGAPGNLGSGATVAANLADIESQTDDIGVAGAGLSAVPDSAGVTTLLSRIPAALFNGITSLASWLGALAGKTADAGTQTEIRATTAGAGYTITTDSLEAIRDRGDASWLTATSVTVSDKTGFKLASDGLALVTAWTVDITGNITGNLSGSVGSLTVGERNSIADAHLDRADAIEVGLTPRQSHRLEAAAAAGKLSGAATATATIRNAVADSKDRITATVDASGNRTAITYDLT